MLGQILGKLRAAEERAAQLQAELERSAEARDHAAKVRLRRIVSMNRCVF
jgi:hypothetical protein